MVEGFSAHLTRQTLPPGIPPLQASCLPSLSPLALKYWCSRGILHTLGGCIRCSVFEHHLCPSDSLLQPRPRCLLKTCLLTIRILHFSTR